MGGVVNIIITEDGEIQAFADGFESAQAAGEKSEELFRKLRALGVKIEVEGVPEQHRPDGARHVHIVDRHRHGH